MEIHLVMYRMSRDHGYEVKGAFSSHDKARQWAEASYGRFVADWHVETMHVDSPRGAW